MPANYPFNRIHHIHVVVRDMAKVEAFLNTIGITLTDYEHPGNYTLLEGNEAEALAAIHYKFARINGVDLQFMSPKDDRPSRHKTFLETRGQGVYSVGFLVDDVDAAEAKGRAMGLKVEQKGRHEDGWGFTYFDTADLLGINLTVRQNPFSERT
ncbi:VOC family protein [Rhodoligotrophos defluvii]|uniref:VOC family protein n=1 Tax=Rhodoligotrophos defluvii TaxID=2561934 RepID=UPI0010C97CF7|nr:VOC family protein [Rhodoligotrophos defluvii]